MNKKILFLAGLFITYLAVGQNPNYKLIESFEYESYADFKQQTNGISFLFNQLESLDLDEDGIVESQEQIRFPDILHNNNDTNSFLKVQLRQNSYQNPSLYAFRQYLRRSELTQETTASGGNQYIKMGDEFWFNFKINPKQFLFDTHPCVIQNQTINNIDVISQIRMGSWLARDIQGITVSPVFDIAISEDKWKIFYDDFTLNQNIGVELSDTLMIDQWVEFKVHMKLANDSSGLLEVWKDGNLVFSKYQYANAPTYDPDGDGVPVNLAYEFKFGLYKPHINSCITEMDPNDPSTDKILYFDDVWLGDYDYSEGLRLVDGECGKIVTMDEPILHLIDVPRDNDYKILLRNLETGINIYFDSPTSEINLLERLPSNLQTNARYQINARIPGHPLFNNYSTSTICKFFTTGDLGLRITKEDCIDNPTEISLTNPILKIYDVPRNNDYTILLRNLSTKENTYFSSSTAVLDLINIYPSNLESNTDYQINARIEGHPLFNDYTESTFCRNFSTGNLYFSFEDRDNKHTIIGQKDSVPAGIVYWDGFLEVTEPLEFLIIYDFTGKLVFEELRPFKGGEQILNGLKRGFYILKTNLGTKKIMIY